MIDIQQKDNGRNGYFEARIDGNYAGAMTYTWAGEDKFIIDHTEVMDKYNGQGIGKHILLKVVDFARKKEVKIIPLCPFAKGQFAKHPEFQDVLY